MCARGKLGFPRAFLFVIWIDKPGDTSFADGKKSNAALVVSLQALHRSKSTIILLAKRPRKATLSVRKDARALFCQTLGSAIAGQPRLTDQCESAWEGWKQVGQAQLRAPFSVDLLD